MYILVLNNTIIEGLHYTCSERSVAGITAAITEKKKEVR